MINSKTNSLQTTQALRRKSRLSNLIKVLKVGEVIKLQTERHKFGKRGNITTSRPRYKIPGRLIY